MATALARLRDLAPRCHHRLVCARELSPCRTAAHRGEQPHPTLFRIDQGEADEIERHQALQQPAEVGEKRRELAPDRDGFGDFELLLRGRESGLGAVHLRLGFLRFGLGVVELLLGDKARARVGRLLEPRVSGLRGGVSGLGAFDIAPEGDAARL